MTCRNGNTLCNWRDRCTACRNEPPVVVRPLTCEACGKPIGDGDDDCGPCVNCRLPICVHDDRYDVNHDGYCCPRACNARSPKGEICDDIIAHDGPHRWEHRWEAP